MSRPVFRTINKGGKIGENAFSPKVIWGVVKATCSKCGLDRVAPHDLRGTCRLHHMGRLPRRHVTSMSNSNRFEVSASWMGPASHRTKRRPKP